ncbi:MAG: NAD(P)/FAD-dependent oxidoreductase [Clostridiales bacterium]|nr:NAD(P)/FAD-dependent oxidoreductase [Clostridiales bacterium]
MYDVAIIGGGPAGVSAAVTLKSLHKNFIWFGKKALSEKIRKAELVRNYPGLPAVSGEELAKAFSAHIAEMGIEITEKTVTGVYMLGTHYAIACDKETFEAKSVILATGVEAVKPIVGELEFLGRGVSYCATCDGFLYKDKTIAVVCASKEFEHEAEYLADLAGKVYFVPVYKDANITRENVEIVRGFPTGVQGERKVSSLVFKDKEIAVDGVFFLKSAISPSALVPGLEMENGHVKVDRDCKTNLAGCFACGDCTGRPYQYAKASGEGNVSAHSAVAYLAGK